MIKKMTIEL